MAMKHLAYCQQHGLLPAHTLCSVCFEEDAAGVTERLQVLQARAEKAEGILRALAACDPREARGSRCLLCLRTEHDGCDVACPRRRAREFVERESR